MLPRERVLTALAFRPVDRIPLQLHPSPGGLFEHGQKMLDLMLALGHDFGSLDGVRLPDVPATDFDSDGRYHRFATDEWGTSWEYRLYGVWGHRTGYPLADLAKLDTWRPPPIARLDGDALAQAKATGAAHRQKYYHVSGGVSLFETMQSLRPFEDVLIEISQDAAGVNRLADMLVEYYAAIVENALAVGADAISVGDDYGTQKAMMIAPRTWRRFFKPRYRALFEPVRAAGKHILFHSCGCVGPILEDLAELGVTAVWPQLPLFDHRELARQCRELGLAVQLHPDRGELMQRATPEQVRAYLLQLVEEFDTLGGGSWLYLEVDPGFPWENVRTMYETAFELRG